MTNQPTTTEYRASDRYRVTAAELAERQPLPTVDEIAGPVLRGLLALHDLGEQTRIDGFAFGVERGEFLDEASEVLALIEQVATAVEIGVAKFLRLEAQAMHAWNARAIVMAIADVDDLRVTTHTPAHERITYDD